MNWKFWKKGIDKPTPSQKIAAFAPWVRIIAILLNGTAQLFLMALMCWIIFIGVDNTQVSPDVSFALKSATVLGMVASVIFGVFNGLISKTKGFAFYSVVISIIILSFWVIEGVGAAKGLLSNQAILDNGRNEAQAAIDSIDKQIKDKEGLVETFRANASKPADVQSKKAGWLAIEAGRQNQDAAKRAEKAANDQKTATDELSVLRAKRAAMKLPPPTETSILGGSVAQGLRVGIVVVLILMTIICSRIQSVLIDSFSVHKSNKYVAENNQYEAIVRREPEVIKSPPPPEPNRPVAPSTSPDLPREPKAGDLPNVSGAVGAGLIAVGAASPAFAVAHSTAAPSIPTVNYTMPVSVTTPTGTGFDGAKEAGEVGMGGGIGGFEDKSQPEPVPVAVAPLPRVKYSEFAQLLAASREGIKSGE